MPDVPRRCHLDQVHRFAVGRDRVEEERTAQGHDPLEPHLHRVHERELRPLRIERRRVPAEHEHVPTGIDPGGRAVKRDLRDPPRSAERDEAVHRPRCPVDLGDGRAAWRGKGDVAHRAPCHAWTSIRDAGGRAAVGICRSPAAQHHHPERQQCSPDPHRRPPSLARYTPPGPPRVPSASSQEPAVERAVSFTYPEKERHHHAESRAGAPARDRPHGMTVRVAGVPRLIRSRCRAAENGQRRRPRVVILGGGFAGVGAAHEAEGRRRRRRAGGQARLPHVPAAPVPVSPPACSRPPRSATRCATSSTTRTTPPSTRRPSPAVDLDAREVRFAELTPLTYDYLVFALGAEVNFFGTEGAAEHAFPMYTLPDAVRLKDHILGRWEAADRRSRSSSTTARSTSSSSAAARRGSRARGRSRSSTAGDFTKDYPNVPQDQARAHPRRGRPGAVPDVQGGHPRRTRQKALAKRARRGDGGRDRGVGLADAGDAEVGQGAQGAHAHLGRGPAGQRARPVARARARARGTGSRSARS